MGLALTPGLRTASIVQTKVFYDVKKSYRLEDRVIFLLQISVGLARPQQLGLLDGNSLSEMRTAQPKGWHLSPPLETPGVESSMDPR